MAVIAFIGLGQMGAPMASNLLKQGHQLSVFDVNADAVQRLVEKGAQPARSPAQAAEGAEFVITMLPNGDLVHRVLLGEGGVCESLSPQALVIDMSTIHPLQTDKLIADLRAKGFSMMDVPVGRTSDHAVAGTLLLLAGGTPDQVERATPVLMAMGNELINLVKDTSLARVIAVYELIWAGQAFIKSSGIIWPLLMTGAFYLVFSGLLVLAFNALEKKLSYFES